MHAMLSSNSVHVDVIQLEKHINKGKGSRTPCHKRYYPLRNWCDILVDSGQVFGSNCTASPNVRGKFDLFNDVPCLRGISPLLFNLTRTLEEGYSVLILSLGIWEIVRPRDCRSSNTSETPEKLLIELLDSLNEISNPSLFITWKTHGSTAHEQSNLDMRQKTMSLIQTAERWFASTAPQHMGLANFGAAVSPRSHGLNRIVGDLKPHWGYEARLLSMQLIGYLVLQNQAKIRTQHFSKDQ